MIIFDLDDTLSDCEPRRHFIDPKKAAEKDIHLIKNEFGKYYYINSTSPRYIEAYWKPDWKAFYEACDEDKPITSTLSMLNSLLVKGNKIEVWSGRYESIREKTQSWLIDYTLFSSKYNYELRMRAITDHTSDDQLKERWLDETISTGKVIDFVFDSHPKSIQMWRRRGIFVFDCNQSTKEF